MTQSVESTDQELIHIKNRIIARPQIVLDDTKVLRALASVQNNKLGENVIDGRGLAIGKLEEKLVSIEAENRTLRQILRENSESMNNIHQAALTLMEVSSIQQFRNALEFEIPQLLKVDRVVLLLDGTVENRLTRMQGGPVRPTRNAIARGDYLRLAQNNPGTVVMRRVTGAPASVYGKTRLEVRSEALLPVAPDDTGPGVVVLGSVQPRYFQPNMSTTLLEFLRDVLAGKVRQLTE